METMYGLLAYLPNYEERIERCPVNWVPVELTTADVDITVRGFVAHLSIDLHYLNTRGKTTEVTYTCPVDAKSAIFEFTAELSGRIIQGQCTERKKAEKLYKDAVQAGHQAIIATEATESSDVLQLSLGNLDMGEKAKIHLEMVMELPVETDGSVRFNFPVVFNPRYSSEFELGHPQPVVATNSAIKGEISSLNIKAEVVGNLIIDRITSATSTFNLQMAENDTEAKMSHVIFSKQDKDWGFQIFYNSPHQAHVLKETCDRTSTGPMADDIIMINLYPEIPMESYSPHNEIIFLVDCSGSMGFAGRTEQAKNSLHLFLKSLPQGCRFNIVKFGSSFTSLFAKSGSERYTEKTLEEALKFQSTVAADMGGTEIFNALRHIYSKEPTQGYSRQILVLTDGDVWNIQQILDLVERNSKDTRVFSVGIGEGASTALVRGIAEAGKGRNEMIKDSDALQIKVMGLVASMLQQSVTDVNVKIELDPPGDVCLIPKDPPTIFGGQHYISFARAPPKSTVKSVSISGITGGKKVCYEVEERDCRQIHDEKLSLHRMAAKKQIQEWQIRGSCEADELVALSVASGVVCSKTAIVGIDQEGKNYKVEILPPNLELENSTYKNYPGILRLRAGGTRNGSLFGAAQSRPMGAASSTNNSSEIFIGAAFPPQASGFSGRALFGSGQSERGGAMNFISKKKRATECLYSSDGVMRDEDSDDSADDLGCGLFGDFESKPKDSIPTSKLKDSLLTLLFKQNFDGSWDKDSQLMELLTDLQLNRLEELQIELQLDDQCLATALCLAWFSVVHEKRKQEWTLIAAKGSMFLKSKSFDLDQLVDKFSAILK